MGSLARYYSSLEQQASFQHQDTFMTLFDITVNSRKTDTLQFYNGAAAPTCTTEQSKRKESEFPPSGSLYTNAGPVGLPGKECLIKGYCINVTASRTFRPDVLDRTRRN